MASSRPRRGMQLHARLGMGVCFWYIVFYHGPSTSQAVVAWQSFPRPTDLMKSQAAVMWHGNQIHQGSAKMAANRTAPTAVLCFAWREKQSCGTGAKAPLRAIKYSSAIQHRALGSVPAATNCQENCAGKQQ
ncbi:unnamed protein product [Pleuronectes platessa]|uniref:Uncharacterized protein n=1 Tax=Pleuronectes platessa TaxID=8262 RepID=A0A9N7YRJ7_PLEPL|nr:unnamed protein product [Pleuronectes platessa]